jgi:hypothetical protein
MAVHEVVIAIGVMLLLVVVGTALACGLLVHRMTRSNRVVPDRRSSAPLTWLWSWASAARLHRRLRRAMQVVAYSIGPLRPPARRRQPAPPVSPLVDVADALMARAAHVDDCLVSASRAAPQWRSYLLADLSRAVAEVEASVAHLGRVAAAWRTQLEAAAPANPLPPLDVRARLSAVEAALAEVAHAASGGIQPYAGPVTRPPDG